MRETGRQTGSQRLRGTLAPRQEPSAGEDADVLVCTRLTETLPCDPRGLEPAGPDVLFCCTLKRYICTYSIYIHTYYTHVCSARVVGGLSSLAVSLSPCPPPGPVSFPPLTLVSAVRVCGTSQEKWGWTQTAGPAGWSQARLRWGCDLCGPVACGRPDCPPESLLHWPPHPRLGFYLPPHAPVVGGLPGASLQLFPLPPYLCP